LNETRGRPRRRPLTPLLPAGRARAAARTGQAGVAGATSAASLGGASTGCAGPGTAAGCGRAGQSICGAEGAAPTPAGAAWIACPTTATSVTHAGSRLAHAVVVGTIGGRGYASAVGPAGGAAATAGAQVARAAGIACASTSLASGSSARHNAGRIGRCAGAVSAGHTAGLANATASHARRRSRVSAAGLTGGGAAPVSGSPAAKLASSATGDAVIGSIAHCAYSMSGRAGGATAGITQGTAGSRIRRANTLFADPASQRIVASIARCDAPVVGSAAASIFAGRTRAAVLGRGAAGAG